MKLSFTTLDVFTSTRYAGNPLAVIEVPASQKSSLAQVQKQKIAAEFNLSEIIFVHETSSNETSIDIFMPDAEIPFAGHPTIGAAYFLLHMRKQPIVALIEKCGRLPISEGQVTGEVKADVPQDFHIHDITFKSELTESSAACVSIVKGMSFIFVHLPDLPTLANARGNLKPAAGTACLDQGWQEGLLGTMYFVARGQDEFGRKVYRTRMFVDFEDPGTGSASCALGCWLASQGEGEKFSFVQGVEMGRRNDISVEVVAEGEMVGKGKGIKSVRLSGTCVQVMEGTLEI
jgi:PhzF family phenazine biosynthesis protein